MISKEDVLKLCESSYKQGGRDAIEVAIESFKKLEKEHGIVVLSISDLVKMLDSVKIKYKK